MNVTPARSAVMPAVIGTSVVSPLSGNASNSAACCKAVNMMSPEAGTGTGSMGSMGSTIGSAGSSPPLWTQPYMTAVRATIEHAAIKLRVSFVFFMAPRLSFEEASIYRSLPRPTFYCSIAPIPRRNAHQCINSPFSRLFLASPP